MPKKTAFFAIAMVVVLAAAGCAIFTRGRPRMSDLQFSLSLPKANFAIGEQVLVMAKVQNQSDTMFPFPSFRQGAAPRPVYQIRRPDGQVVTYDPTRKEDRVVAEQDRPFHWMVPLYPSLATTDVLYVAQVAPLNIAGEYVVSARFKWRNIDLVAEPVSFSLAAIHFSDITFADNLPEPGAPATEDPNDPMSWGNDGHRLRFRVVDGSDGSQVGTAKISWKSPLPEPSAMYEYMNSEWPLTIGGASAIGASKDAVGGIFAIQAKGAPDGGRLIPTQCASKGIGSNATHFEPYFWTPQLVQYGWETSDKRDSFEWFQAPSPKPIAQAIRALYASPPGPAKAQVDILVVFAGETAELGHFHIEGVYEKPEATALRSIASLGPGWVAAQAIIGPPALDNPKLVASIARHASGTQVTFLRVDSTGAVVAKAARVLAHLIPLGPVALQVRASGAEVEAAFPVKDARSGALHAVRVKAPVGLAKVGEPVVSPPIDLPEPTPTMLIAFSWFGAPFPQGLGLLLRQPGDKAFFWTEQRGLKPLGLTLHDQEEALILGKRASWYVLVNTGTVVRGVNVESFYSQYRPEPPPIPRMPEGDPIL
jgi:hypothetical protein